MDWAATIARHVLYETADAIRIEALAASDDPVVAGIAARIDREEVYHRMHAEMWLDRLLASADGRKRLDRALDELWPYGLGVLDEGQRPELRRTLEERLDRALPDVEPAVRGTPRARARGAARRDDLRPPVGSRRSALVTPTPHGALGDRGSGSRSRASPIPRSRSSRSSTSAS